MQVSTLAIVLLFTTSNRSGKLKLETHWQIAFIFRT